MRPSILAKLDFVLERHEELEALLSESEVVSDQKRFQSYSKEYAQLEPIVICYRRYKTVLNNLEEAKILAEDFDASMRELAELELAQGKEELEKLENELQILVLPKDPHDESNIFLEIRAGTGGDEAAIFAGNLFRMYSRFAEDKGWQVELLNESHGEHGGYKEVIARIIGHGAYSQLKFESGAHRVQRVPATESQGRVHTSACTVAILPELAEVEAIDINPSDLRIDTYRASGAGGQHVNRTDSAVRITHLPSGIVVECQDERSQHKNKARAMSLLQAKLLDQARSKQQSEQAEQRRNLVGSGDRSERIRTYNYPQNRITDHRINLTVYKLDEVMEGKLSQVIAPLTHEHNMDLLATMET